MKIGDRVFVRGYIDEIRKDTVIIRNAGGYFGTIPSEVITGELPSAQPEVIRCKDCLWRIGRDCTRFTDLPVYMDDYCGRAKRRGEQDETD